MALAPSLPNLFFFKTKSLDSHEECVNDFVGLKIDGLVKKGYFILVFLVIFVIPLVRDLETSIIVSSLRCQLSSLDCDADALLPYTD